MSSIKRTAGKAKKTNCPYTIKNQRPTISNSPPTGGRRPRELRILFFYLISATQRVVLGGGSPMEERNEVERLRTLPLKY